jgi:hydrogenase nickel incorporation protein HypA/HybF
MDRVEQEATARGAVAVQRVVVRIGELSGIEVALLRTAYENLRARTICACAPLDVDVVPVRWVCQACGAGVPGGGRLRCGVCDGAAVLRQGDEILLERIDLEVV